MTTFLAVRIAAALVSAVLLVACGGGGGDQLRTTPAASVTAVDGDEPPGGSVSPTNAGIDAGQLLENLQALGAGDLDLHGLVVVRGGTTVIDQAFWPAEGDTPHDLASVTKSVVTLVVGAAIERGYLPSIDVPLAELLPIDAAAPAAERTLADLLGMRSGLACSADAGEQELRELQAAEDPVAYASSLPAAGRPGERFAYCSPGYHLVSAALGSAIGQSLAGVAAEVLFEPLGIEDWSWESDAQGVTHGWGDLALRPTDLARVGQLLLQGGTWSGQQLLPAGFVAALRADPISAGGDDRYGLGWWLPPERYSGAIEAAGRGGQLLFVWPEQELAVVVTGASTDARAVAYAIADAIAADVAPDETADRALLDHLRTIAAPGPAGPVSTPSGEARLGATFALADNELGIASVAVDITGAEAIVTLGIGGAILELPVGLDGVARIAATSPTDGPAALTGTWSGTVLTIDYESTRGPDHLDLVLDAGATDGSVVLSLRDRTGELPPLDLVGTAP